MSEVRPTLRALYDRVAGPDGIEREGLASYLKGLGIGRGFLGGTQLDAAVSHFMKLDADDSERVEWPEFVRGGKALLPEALRGADGRLDRARVEEVWGKLARKKSAIKLGDLSRYLEREVSTAVRGTVLALFAGTIAEAGARLALDALDADRNAEVEKGDLYALVDDINQELDRVG